MGKRRYLLWATCVLAAITSCDRECEITESADAAIRFDNRSEEAYAAAPTRGTATGDFTGFGVFAYYAAEGTYNAGTSEPDYMYNVHVTRSDAGAWTYSPLKFWPQGTVSFFAYTPYDTDATVSVACGKGAPRVTYAIPDAVGDHRDLMLSAPALDRTKAGGTVSLKFAHALAALIFEARVNGEVTAGQSICVTEIRIGKFRHRAECHHELPGGITQEFTADAADKEYVLSPTDGTLQQLALTSTFQQISSATGCAMLWPQSITSDDQLTITTEYTLNNITRELRFTRNIREFVTAMQSGKRYVFGLQFDPFGEMQLECTVQPWTEKTIDVPAFD